MIIYFTARSSFPSASRRSNSCHQFCILGLRQLHLQVKSPTGLSLQIINVLLMILTKPDDFTG
jgi:hypothetical protein